jgi:hypothetical protein
MADATKELDAMQTSLAALKVLDPEERQRAMTWLASALEVELQPGDNEPAVRDSDSHGASGPASSGSGSGAPDPKTFLADKAPNTDVERIACLAYYLSKYRGQRAFKTGELTDLNVEAAGRAIGNPSRAADNASRASGFLASAGSGQRQITRVGEEVVEALPDREKAKAIQAKGPKRRRAKGKKAKK